MLTEFVSLFERLHLHIAALAMGLLIGVLAGYLIALTPSGSWRKKNTHWARTIARGRYPRRPRFYNKTDAVEQLRIVMAADFSARPILNKSEARVFRELEQIVMRCNPAWQAMAQVSLGEILSSKNVNAFGCINSKRVDMLLVDEHCRPRHAIEYQGGAHYQKDAAARDAVKREALRRAGIGYHEVVAGQTTPGEFRQLIEKLVTGADAPTK